MKWFRCYACLAEFEAETLPNPVVNENGAEEGTCVRCGEVAVAEFRRIDALFTKLVDVQTSVYKDFELTVFVQDKKSGQVYEMRSCKFVGEARKKMVEAVRNLASVIEMSG